MIDDMSTDNTLNKMNDISKRDNRFSYIQNYEKKYALKNIVEAAREYQNDDDIIIGVIDGDDFLCNDRTVRLLTDTYAAGFDVVWTAHKWDINSMNISTTMPDHVNPYFWPWASSHLRTFKAALLSSVTDENFKDRLGNWFKRGYDQALMLPILHQTNKRMFIDEVCYQYNINSVSMEKRDWEERDQISTINFVRSRGFLE